MRLARAIASLSYLSLLPGAAAFVSSAAAAMSSAAPHRAHDDATMDPVGSPLSPGGRPDGAIATFGSSTADRATDFANYFCAYAQLHHQKQMLTDHHRMAAYHAAIAGNPDVFKDKVRSADLPSHASSSGCDLVCRGRSLGRDLVRRGRSFGRDLVRRGRLWLYVYLAHAEPAPVPKLPERVVCRW